MPILRNGYQLGPGDGELLMAFIEVPSLRVVPSRQRYTHLRPLANGGAIVRYRSGSFSSSDALELRVDQLGIGGRQALYGRLRRMLRDVERP